MQQRGVKVVVVESRAVTTESRGSAWRKSSRSAEGNCVEVASLLDWRLVRDSKLDGKSPVLVVSVAAFAAVLRDLRQDLLG